ncbi:MAG: GNAT family N-acetyltransferase [Algoriphagus sp.]|uniref:GNAT family N-acetyltransferase n=1 Tax=Algoriphagus sp. TaxID=1872435 RepID=UPI0017C3CA44|nr:GNAT family N-acetyltransferase [Algoriphagus sp.]NVJ87717.1 GNAT family N-acetyltransferase [Algoriphagus sp.]
MVIRKGTEEDIPQIIQLLKESLGESLLPKTEAFWKWKHFDNPFGPSPVLLAEKENQIIGVRAFLRWQFTDQNKNYRACRAVDTAVHPKYQGQGIFSRLTQELVEEMKNEGVQLIFNTPNKKSHPGYLKLGWETWGKLPLKIKLKIPKSSRSPLPSQNWEEISTLISKLEAPTNIQLSVHTSLIPGYIRWRYQDCPIVNYSFLSDGESYLLIYRLKEGKKGKELRITDLFILSGFEKNKLQKPFRELIKNSGAVWVSFSGLNYDTKVLDLGSIPLLTQGPLITLRKLQDDLDPRFLDWKWSLGDLELF